MASISSLYFHLNISPRSCDFQNSHPLYFWWKMRIVIISFNILFSHGPIDVKDSRNGICCWTPLLHMLRSCLNYQTFLPPPSIWKTVSQSRLQYFIVFGFYLMYLSLLTLVEWSLTLHMPLNSRLVQQDSVPQQCHQSAHLRGRYQIFYLFFYLNHVELHCVNETTGETLENGLKNTEVWSPNAHTSNK